MSNCVFVRVDNREFATRKEKIKSYFGRLFYKIRIERCKDGIIILLPTNYKKYKRRIRRQVEKNFLKEKQLHVIYAEEIEQELNCSELLKKYTGKILMKKLIFQIIELIYNIVHERKEMDDIYVFLNEYSVENLKIIDECVNKFKNVNLITSNITKFKRLERKYEKEGILITVSNNKRKGATKAGIIINVDLDNKSFNKYNINSNAIIINLSKEKNFGTSNFNGVIINDYNIKMNIDETVYMEEFYGNINLKMWLEYKTEELEASLCNELIKEKQVKINQLIGIRGIIEPKEIQNNYKIFKNLNKKSTINY